MPLTQALRDALLPVAARLTRHGGGSDALLILQPDHLGDILCSQPAVRLLRRAFPERRLIGVVGPWAEPIARLAWPVDEVYALPFPGFERAPKASALDPYRLLYREARALRAFGASAAVVLRPDAWWAAWLARAAGVARLAGGDDARVGRFVTAPVAVPPDGHAVERALAIAAALTDLSTVPRASPLTEPIVLPPLDAASEEARALLSGAGVGRDYVVMHPGAGAPVKRWPLDRWRAVARALARDGMAVVVTGSADERELAAALCEGLDATVSLAGATTLPTLIETLRGAALALGPDCGPLHLAVAAGTPTVHVFGPSDPRRYGPWGPAYNHVVARAGWSCPRCGDLSLERQPGCGCMLAVGVDDVLRAATRLLAGHAVA